MAVIYRTAGPWGAGKGANLVAGEVDSNFFDLAQRLHVVEDSMPDAANGIAFFNVSGNLFYVHMTNGTIQGPFVLPQLAWNFVGEWAPNTIYHTNDVVTYNGGVYMVMMNHVSASVFDPNVTDGQAHVFYDLLLTNPGSIIPQGGLTGQYLTKTSDMNYEIGWQTPTVFPAQKLLEAPDATYDLTFDNIASYVRCVNASGCTIMIPGDLTLNFPLSTEISFRQCTGSQVVLTADSAVTLNTIDGLLPKTGRKGGVITAKKVFDNTWDVFGLLGVS